jgi:hypothetical protein
MKWVLAILPALLLAAVAGVSLAQPNGEDGTEGAAHIPSERELLYPDLRVLPAEDLQFDTVVIEGQEQVVLRFSTIFANLGEGRLEVTGTTDPETGATRVVQRIYSADEERYASVRVGDFEFHEGHEHWHLTDFLLFELHRAEGRRLVEPVPGAVAKATFCLRDDFRVAGLTGSPREPVYQDCTAELQGLSTGWADIYAAHLDDQWIELGPPNAAAPLEDGRYGLVNIVNPDGAVFESNTGNNYSVLFFTVRGGVIVLDQG